MTTLPLTEQVLHELRAINQRLAALESAIPRKDIVWLTPSEMSKLCGVSARTLQNYVTKGKLSNACYKQEARGKSFNYRYHRELTLRELGLA